jgi:hypothetical protein
LKRCTGPAKIEDLEVVATSVEGPQLLVDLGANRFRSPGASLIDDRYAGVENPKSDTCLRIG